MKEFKEFKEHQCNCATCVSMCHRFPCRPLPHEVAAMPAEVRARLMSQSDGKGMHHIPHLQAAAVHYEGQEAPDFDAFYGHVGRPHRCTFLTADGLCELHGKCKPFEGRTAVHGECDQGEYQHLKKSWDTDEGRRVLADWKKERGNQP